MNNNIKIYVMPIAVLAAIILASCNNANKNEASNGVIDTITVIKPLYTTEPVAFDTDDPAIWVNKLDPAKSLVIGTDKDENGGLYVFDLKGKMLREKVIKGIKRPNNVDIAYGLKLAGKKVDIAVLTERMTHKLRVFTLPDMKPIDGGGLEVFIGETETMFRDLMGIALYTDPKGNIYAIVGRKIGPKDGGYLWQYLLEDNGQGTVKATLVRKFGNYSGKKEIEAIAVDNELGYVYYSDEQFGVRKYYADPSKGNKELAVFAQQGFAEDHEGISIYKTSATTGYILVSDQSANQFKVYSREGVKNANDHELITALKVSTNQSDGSEIYSKALNDDFKHGLFVAMSDDRTFQYYRWEDLARKQLNKN